MPPTDPENPHQPMTKILFIGNSYTGYNNFPKLFEALGNLGASSPRLSVKVVVDYGGTLQRHWLKSSALTAIQAEHWDYVVLQEHSQLGRLTIDGKEVVNDETFFHTYVRLFDQAIKQAGAKTLLMLTWAHKDRPAEQALLNKACLDIAREIDAQVIPVGPVWQYAQSLLDEDLYFTDGHHPSAYGSLLAASVFYAFFMGDALEADYGAIVHKSFEFRDDINQHTQNMTFATLGSAFHTLLKQARKTIRQFETETVELSLDEQSLRRKPPELPSGLPFQYSDLQGHWVGTLNFYNDSAAMEMAVQEQAGAWVAKIKMTSSQLGVLEVISPLLNTQIDSDINEQLFLYLEITHDIYSAVYTGDSLRGIVRGDHGHYPEPNRFGSWTLTRQDKPTLN